MLLFTEAGSGALDVIRSNSLVKASPHSLFQYSEPLRSQKHSSDTLVFPQFLPHNHSASGAIGQHQTNMGRPWTDLARPGIGVGSTCAQAGVGLSAD